MDLCNTHTDCHSCVNSSGCGQSFKNIYSPTDGMCQAGNSGGSSDGILTGKHSTINGNERKKYYYYDWGWGSNGCDLDKLIAIPSPINVGLTSISDKEGYNWLINKMGIPGECLTKDCNNDKINEKLRVKMIRKKLTPQISVTLFNKFALLLEKIFNNLKNVRQDLYDNVKKDGSLCCRAVRGSETKYSNHSWGLAIDLYFGKDSLPRGTNATQLGIAQLAPYLMNEGIFWAAAFTGRSVDSMHFEVSKELLIAWCRDDIGCENETCPPGDTIIGQGSMPCNAHGSCDTSTGKCSCFGIVDKMDQVHGYTGDDCNTLNCSIGVNDKPCSGRGHCGYISNISCQSNDDCGGTEQSGTSECINGLCTNPTGDCMCDGNAFASPGLEYNDCGCIACSQDSDCNTGKCNDNGCCTNCLSNDGDPCSISTGAGTCDELRGYCMCNYPAKLDINGHCSCFDGDKPNYCNGACVDLNSDSSNCGSCGNVCAGSLENPQKSRCCNGNCIPIDKFNCRFCGNDCTDENEEIGKCQSGNCGCCYTPEAGYGCVDLNVSSLNCGACNIKCNQNQYCCEGKCTDINESNCEGCGKNCACKSGNCKCCVDPKLPWYHNCVDLDNDIKNCGSCGNTCNPNIHSGCYKGQCICKSDGNYACGSSKKCCSKNQTCCGDDCVDTNNNMNNCGACGNKCDPNIHSGCYKGRCICKSDGNYACGPSKQCCAVNHTCIGNECEICKNNNISCDHGHRDSNTCNCICNSGWKKDPNGICNINKCVNPLANIFPIYPNSTTCYSATQMQNGINSGNTYYKWYCDNATGSLKHQLCDHYGLQTCGCPHTHLTWCHNNTYPNCGYEFCDYQSAYGCPDCIEGGQPHN